MPQLVQTFEGKSNWCANFQLRRSKFRLADGRTGPTDIHHLFYARVTLQV